jgi:hypothetical protein
MLPARLCAIVGWIVGMAVNWTCLGQGAATLRVEHDDLDGMVVPGESVEFRVSMST